MDSRMVRRDFVRGLIFGIRIVWPVLSGLLVLIVTLGLVIGWLEGWTVSEALYFSFVSGLTIGYGDLVPKTVVTRLLAVLIGLCGVLLTGIIAAIAVKALTAVKPGSES